MFIDDWQGRLILAVLLMLLATAGALAQPTSSRLLARTAATEMKVYLSTEPAGGLAMDSFGCVDDIFAFVAFGGDAKKKGDIVRAEWIRPDGIPQEAPEIKLKDRLQAGQSVRFRIHFKGDEGTIFDDFSRTTDASAPFLEGKWILKIVHNNSELQSVDFQRFCQ